MNNVDAPTDDAQHNAEEGKVSLDELLKIIGLQQVELYQLQKKLTAVLQRLELLTKPKP